MKPPVQSAVFRSIIPLSFPFSHVNILTCVSPLNFPFTNPLVVETTIRLNGQNFVRGAKNFTEDVTRFLKKEPPVGVGGI